MIPTYTRTFNPDCVRVPKSKLYRGGGIKPVSAQRAKLNKIYSALRKKFLEEHEYCEHWLAENGMTRDEVKAFNRHLSVPRSCDIHHKRGRGKYFLDVSTWMAVSREGHDCIHAHPKESYEKGYMLPR